MNNQLRQSGPSPTPRSAGAVRSSRQEAPTGRSRRETARPKSFRSGPYNYVDLCYKITDFKPEQYPDLKVTGEEARHDLRLFVEDVSAAADVPADDGRRARADGRRAGRDVQRFDQDHSALARARARQPAVRVRRPQAGRLPAKLGRSVRAHERRPRRRAAAASANSPTKSAIWIRRAGSPTGAAGGGAAEVARRIVAQDGPQRGNDSLHAQGVRRRASRCWRSSRTGGGPLSDDDKQNIYQQYRRGESVDALCKRYRRTKTSVYRIINEVRAEKIAALPLDLHRQPAVRQAVGREADSRSLPPVVDTPVARPALRADCRRTWPLCTKSRC